MKLVMICYNEAIDDEVIEILNRAGAKGYTKWTKVLGKGTASGPHLYSHVWPKANNVIANVSSKEVATVIFENVRRLRGKLGSEGIKAFMWEVDDIT